jgi:hypothetical protein
MYKEQKKTNWRPIIFGFWVTGFIILAMLFRVAFQKISFLVHQRFSMNN